MPLLTERKKIYGYASIWAYAYVYVSRIRRHKSHGFLMAAMIYDPEECTRFVGASSCSSTSAVYESQCCFPRELDMVSRTFPDVFCGFATLLSRY